MSHLVFYLCIFPISDIPCLETELQHNTLVSAKGSYLLPDQKAPTVSG